MLKGDFPVAIRGILLHAHKTLFNFWARYLSLHPVFLEVLEDCHIGHIGMSIAFHISFHGESKLNSIAYILLFGFIPFGLLFVVYDKCVRVVKPCDNVVPHEFPNVILCDVPGGNYLNPLSEIICTRY